MRKCSKCVDAEVRIGGMCWDCWQHQVSEDARPDHHSATEQMIIAPPRLAMLQEGWVEFEFTPLLTEDAIAAREDEGWQQVYVTDVEIRWRRNARRNVIAE